MSGAAPKKAARADKAWYRVLKPFCWPGARRLTYPGGGPYLKPLRELAPLAREGKVEILR